MQAYRADRVVRFLTFAVSFVYYLLWLAVVLILVGIPVVKLLAVHGVADADFTMGVPVRVSEGGVPAESVWGPGVKMELTDAHADLQVPFRYAPTWLVGLMWLVVAVSSALALLFVNHLRQLFRRVRDGAPFDARNAVRLRWLGVLLLGLTLWQSVMDTVLSVLVTRAVRMRGMELGSGLQIEEGTVFIALVLLALAEIFRRGTALEEEQSLVV